MEYMTIEEIDKVLIHKNITNVTARCCSNSELYTFERLRDFTVDGEEYTIEWWKNGCFLFYKNLTIPFHSVQQSGTWPNSAKLNLQFRGAHRNMVCVLPIEYYESK